MGVVRGFFGPVLIAAAILTCDALLAGRAICAAEEPEPPGSIHFVGRNLFATANGTFTSWRVVDAKLDRARPENSVVEVEVDLSSLDTGNGRRDRHLRTADFFDVERFPKARIRAHEPQPDGTSESGRPRYRVKLDIDLHGVLETVEATVEVTGADPITVDGRVVLDRTAFEVGGRHNRFNPMSIRNEVPVHFTATLKGAGRD